MDYRIATKALATRLKKALPSIISNSQTGYLEVRFIGENVRQIADLLQFTLDQNLSGIAVSLDFEKAFDSLEWDFLHKALEAFNFGENFRTWIKVMYKNISSCVINNGLSSPFFTLQRGVRQGCPLSDLRFIVAVELLSISIRSSDVIRGIQVSNKEIKLSQYADDTTVFCRDSYSLKELLELADSFQNCSGLKFNYSKSETLWLGKDANCTDTPFGLKWPQDPICALGTCFSYDRIRCEKENFSSKVNQIKKLFNI